MKKQPYLRKKTQKVLKWIHDNPDVLKTTSIKEVSEDIYNYSDIEGTVGSFRQLITKLIKKGVIRRDHSRRFYINYGSNLVPKNIKNEPSEEYRLQRYSKKFGSMAKNKGMSLNEFHEWQIENLRRARTIKKQKQLEKKQSKKVLHIPVSKKIEVKEPTPNIRAELSKDGKKITLQLNLTISLD